MPADSFLAAYQQHQHVPLSFYLTWFCHYGFHGVSPSINRLVTFTAETAYQIVRSLPDHTNFTIYNNNMDFLVGGCLRDIILGKPPKIMIS